MKELWNKIKQNRVKSIIATVVVILLVILVFFGSSLGLDFLKSNQENQMASLVESDIVADLLEKLNEQQDKDSATTVVSTGNSFTDVINGVTYFKKVRVPVLSNQKLFDYSGLESNSCGDQVIWSFVDIEPTRAPLTAGIKFLLDSDMGFDFEPGNFLAKQSNLSLKEVIIENRVAKIYLDGEFTLEDDCDEDRKLTQIQMIAMQFGTVDSVEVYLNDELVK